MATGSRTLKLAILAETKQLTSNLKSAEKDVQGFGDKMGDIGKKVGLAFAAAAAAAGAYAIKIGIDGVKSAIEDEAAQLLSSCSTAEFLCSKSKTDFTNFAGFANPGT